MNIKVYSTSTCPACKKVKDYLTENGIEFVEKRVDRDNNFAREMISKSNQQSVPVIEIDEEIIVGFNKPEIDKKLGI